jgi:membrane fusion protein (multidrug efflux system)
LYENKLGSRSLNKFSPINYCLHDRVKMESTYQKYRQTLRLCAVGLLLFVVGCEKTDVGDVAAPESRLPKVRTLTLKPMPWIESIQTHGVIEAAEEVDVTIDFSATVRSVHFREGAPVAMAEPIIDLDRGKRELHLSRVTTSVTETKAQLEQASSNLERRQELYQKNLISREQYDQARTARQSAGARYQEALAAQRLAQRELGETQLLSPVSGRIAKRLVDPGETVMPGQSLAVIQTTDSVRVVTYVSEKDINALRVGTQAQVTTPGVPGRAYQAVIESVGIKADPATGNFTVKLTIQNKDGLLRDGMTATAELQGIEYPEALLVPESAVVDRNRHRVVYKVVDNRAVEVQPVFRASMREHIPVLDGLESGDILIVSGLENVIDGAEIEMLAPANGP